MILNHVGGPLGIGPYAGKRDAVFAAWKADIAELARCPNVVREAGRARHAISARSSTT